MVAAGEGRREVQVKAAACPLNSPVISKKNRKYLDVRLHPVELRLPDIEQDLRYPVLEVVECRLL